MKLRRTSMFVAGLLAAPLASFAMSPSPTVPVQPSNATTIATQPSLGLNVGGTKWAPSRLERAMKKGEDVACLFNCTYQKQKQKQGAGGGGGGGHVGPLDASGPTFASINAAGGGLEV